MLLVLSSRGRFISSVPGTFSLLPGTRPETAPHSPASWPCTLPPACCLCARPFPGGSGSAPTTWPLPNLPGARHSPPAPPCPQSPTPQGSGRAATPGSGPAPLRAGLGAEPAPTHVAAPLGVPSTRTPGQASRQQRLWRELPHGAQWLHGRRARQ